MLMSEAEIRQDYEQGKNKREMIKVLADQNCVRTHEMAQFLVDLGYDVDKRLLLKPKTRARTEKKEPDQSVKADAGKPRISLVPMQILFDIARIREYGNAKYPDGGPDNWKQVEPERYREAALRHMLRYIDDPQGLDEESGLPHLAHLACNIAFLCELEGEE